MPTITAFADSPDGGEGHARDMRVRWALEELGVDYGVRLLSFAEMKEPAHLALHPFGQIPTFENGEITLFETGAILLHLARNHPGLLPQDAAARERAVMWLFAALNTVEPPIVEREQFRIVERDKPWFSARLALLDENVQRRLGQLSDYLGDREWLEGEFTLGDLMMVMVLRRLEDGPNLLGGYPNLLAYVARGEARTAYRRAFAAQKAVFEARQRRD